MATSTWSLPKAMFDHLDWTNDQLAIDFGGSALKIIHIPASRITDAGDKVNLDLHILPVSKLDEALLQLVNLLGGENRRNTMTVNATGQIANANLSTIQQKLNVSVQLHEELECISLCLIRLMSSVPRQLIVDDVSEAAQRDIDSVIPSMMEISKVYKSSSSSLVMPLSDKTLKPEFWKRDVKPCDQDVPYGTACDDVYPFVIALLGSAAVFIKIDASGAMEFLELSPRCGKSFLGLASLLKGISDFNELISMAEKGSSAGVNFAMWDIGSSSSTEDDGSAMYNSLSKFDVELSAYSWGKVVGKTREEVKTEDIVRGLLAHLCQELADLAFHNALRTSVHRVLVTGSFSQHPLVQFEFARACGFKRLHITKYDVQVEFVKNGGHLGALGTLLKLNQ